jgi:hypothetical protein
VNAVAIILSHWNGRKSCKFVCFQNPLKTIILQWDNYEAFLWLFGCLLIASRDSSIRSYYIAFLSIVYRQNVVFLSSYLLYIVISGDLLCAHTYQQAANNDGRVYRKRCWDWLVNSYLWALHCSMSAESQGKLLGNNMKGASLRQRWRHATIGELWKRRCSSVVDWGTMLQAGRSRVRFPMRSLDFSIDLMLPGAL